MSTHLHMYARLDGTFTSKCGTISFNHPIIDEFELIQTPSDITEKILESPSVLKSYKEYITSLDLEEVIPVYSENDILQEGEVVDYDVIKTGEKHRKELDDFLESHKNFQIIWKKF